VTSASRRRFEDFRHQRWASIAVKYSDRWTSGNLPGLAERKLGFCMHSTSAVVGCGESLIVGPGFACLCLSHDTCMERRILYCSRLGISQRISGLEGVCDMLIIGGMLSSPTGKVAILVGLYVSHFCANTWKSPASATTFHVCPVACTKSLFFVTQRRPARGIYVHMVHRTADKTRFRFYATPHDSGMRKIKNTMITAPARVSALH
jgi:hypothetical protein